MADPISDVDDQDQSEVFDEDNTNPQERGPGEEAEQFEDLVDVFDVTARAGDADEDEPQIGDDLDDEEIVASARDNDDDGDDPQDDDLVRGEEVSFAQEDDLTSASDGDDTDPDAVGDINRRRGDEVELEYVGSLNDLDGAASAAQSLESESLSDRDLRELDYKDQFTRDDKEPDAPPT